MPRASIQWATSETRAGDDGDTVSTTISEIVMDAVTAHGREASADLPDHPVEGASSVSDHVVPHPRRVSLEVHISSAPYDLEISPRASSARPPLVRWTPGRSVP